MSINAKIILFFIRFFKFKPINKVEIRIHSSQNGQFKHIFKEKMLAFAKDITIKDPNHPEEAKNSELKEYMNYQRSLDHERLIYHALDYSKTELQNSKKNWITI
jgi:hypothetical protein